MKLLRLLLLMPSLGRLVLMLLNLLSVYRLRPMKLLRLLLLMPSLGRLVSMLLNL
jgi:hypothetical protein